MGIPPGWFVDGRFKTPIDTKSREWSSLIGRAEVPLQVPHVLIQSSLLINLWIERSLEDRQENVFDGAIDRLRRGGDPITGRGDPEGKFPINRLGDLRMIM